MTHKRPNHTSPSGLASHTSVLTTPAKATIPYGGTPSSTRSVTASGDGTPTTGPRTFVQTKTNAVNDTVMRRSVPHVAAARETTQYPRTTIFPATDSTEVTLQRVRERFEEVASLGRGGVGEVALAKDHDIGRTVAVKRLLAPTDDSVLARFIEEIRVVGQLEHPNIVPVHDVGVDADGRYYFVMKHIEGESLESVIDTLKRGDPAAHARFSFAARGQLVVSVLNALTYAHQRGFVHRDLKPSNVMVGPYGEVTIVDWGLAKRMHLGRAPALVEGCARLPRQNGAVSPMGPPTETYASVARGAKETIDGEVMGTPAYMAPEQARGQHSACDERTDLYAVGTVLYELMHLQHPLEAQLSLPLPHLLEAVQHQAPPFHAAPTFQPAQSTVPAEMDWFLKTALQKDPAKRFQTAEEMAARLRGLLEGRFPVQCHRTLAKRVLSEGAACIDRYPRAFIIGSTAVVAVLLGGLVNALL